MADNTENTQQVLQGTYYGYIKCTYTNMYDAAGQLLFSFTWTDNYQKRPIVYATNIQYGIDKQEVYLTPYARQRFLDILEDAGWCVNTAGQLEEIPLYGKVLVYTAPHIELNEQGGLVEVREKIEKTVRKKYTNARHNYMYVWAVKILPYILNADTPVYTRSRTIRWDKNDIYGNEIADQEAKEQAEQEAREKAAALAAKAKRTKTLGILTAIATILTTK